MKKRLVFAGVVVAGLVITMAVAQAQRPDGQGPGQGLGRMGRGPGGPGMGRGGRGGPGLMLAGLGLTDNQKTQVKNVLEAERDAVKADAKALQEARQALHQAIFGAGGNLSVADLQAKVLAAEQAMLAHRIQTQTALADILTPEQKAKMLSRRGRGPGRGPDGGDR